MSKTRDKLWRELLLGIAWLALVATMPLSAQEPVTYKGHTSTVISVCLTPDGKRIASAGSYDKTGQEMLSCKTM